MANERCCILCYKVLEDNHQELNKIFIEMLEVLLINVNIINVEQQLVCNICLDKIRSAFGFKTTCIETMDCLLPYLKPNGELNKRLMDVYLKERNECAVHDGMEVCRLCLKLFAVGSGVSLFSTLEDMHFVENFEKYIPEVTLKSTEDTTICGSCLISLQHLSDLIFMVSCLSPANQTFGITSDNSEMCNGSETPQMVIIKEEVIKEEVIEIEENLENVKKKKTKDRGKTTKNTNKRCKKRKRDQNERTKDDVTEMENSPENVTQVLLRSEVSPNKPRKNQLIDGSKRSSTIRAPQVEHVAAEVQDNSDSVLGNLLTSDNEKYTSTPQNCNESESMAEGSPTKCAQQNDEEIENDVIEIDDEIEADEDIIEVIEDDEFEDDDVEVVGVEGFDNNVIVIDSEMTNTLDMVYECDLCLYKTEDPNAFIRHEQGHSDKTLGAMFHCSVCTFKTRTQSAKDIHMLAWHKELVEKQDLRCRHCSFQTMYSYYFCQHVKGHKYDANYFRCPDFTCSYQTKYRNILKRHRTIFHPAPCFKCDDCDFETGQVHCLKAHRKYWHESSSVAPKNDRCAMCNFKTLDCEKLKSHIRSRHPIFNCSMCDYITSNKQFLKKHERYHRTNICPVSCNFCTYESNSQHFLDKHLAVHTEGQQMEYICRSCKFITRQSEIYEDHMKNHGNTESV